MDDATARALRAHNQRFYERHADEFSATRRAPWPGWQRLLPHLEQQGAGERALRILDVGCGNGRFAKFLGSTLATSSRVSYVGVDASRALLALARGIQTPAGLETRWSPVDFLEDGSELPEGPFDCAVLFGVLHEVPGRERRQRLIEQMAQRLPKGGLLALTAWRFAELPRFQRRIVPWERWSEHALTGLDTSALDAGDHLLPWREGAAVRYAHALDPAEIAAAAAALALRQVETYTDDGRTRDLNRYSIFRAP